MTSDKSLTRARMEVILRVNCNIGARKTGRKDILGQLHCLYSPFNMGGIPKQMQNKRHFSLGVDAPTPSLKSLISILNFKNKLKRAEKYCFEPKKHTIFWSTKGK